MVKQAYEMLKEDSEILFPLGPCDFSPLIWQTLLISLVLDGVFLYN